MTLLPAATAPRFALSRWFAWLSLLVIITIAGLSVALLSWFITQRMLWQEASLTRDFVQSMVRTDRPLQEFLTDPSQAALAPAAKALQHMAQLPNMLRCNVFDREGRLVWSSDARRVGEKLPPSTDLNTALAGHVVISKKSAASPQHGAPPMEAMTLKATELFVEIYVPVRLVDNGPVLAVIEFYRNPRGLVAILDELWRYIVLGAGVAAVLLFATLFGLVHRADRLLAQQEQRLVQAETFAAVGEMSSVVAHGIRNPLAVIRSSAELLLEGADAASRQAARDIVQQTDRLGQWLKDLLAYTQVADERAQVLALAPLLQAAVNEMGVEAQRHGVTLQAVGALTCPPVLADALGVQQVLRTVLLNAVEAVAAQPGQVRLSLAADAPAGCVRVRVHDSGPGLAPAQLARVGRPFHTTKPQGLGVGLALARRVLERSGATLTLHSAVGQGTTVDIDFRLA